MNETFRMSEAGLRRHRQAGILTILIVLIVLSVQFNGTQQDISVSLPVCAIVLAIAMFVAVRRYREMRKTSSAHTLILLDDALVFRDGEVEMRVPYTFIASVTVPPTVRETSQVTVVLRDDEKLRLQGYERQPHLIELLLQKVSPDLVRTRGWG